jgi:hypothetical protein
MKYTGSCHCGRITFEVEGEIKEVIECNCSHCSRKGYLLHFLPKEKLRITSPAATLNTYLFNKHVIEHKFCSKCGCAPFGFGKAKDGSDAAMVNVRCLPDLDRSKLKITPYDGASK